MSRRIEVQAGAPSAVREAATCRLGVSLVLYRNSPSDVSAVLDSLRASPFDTRVCVVDNSPTDDLRALVESGGARYLHDPSNPGFGASHNRAFEALQGTDFHLVVNPDVYFPASSLESLVAYLRDEPQVGLVSPRVLFPDGELQYLCKRYPSLLVLFGRRFLPSRLRGLVKRRNDWFEMRETGYDKIMDVPYATGCFMLFRREALERVGGFDARFFLYMEDADISLRVAQSGFGVKFFPGAHVFHHWARGSHKSWRLTLASIRSTFQFFSKHGWRLY
jgi:hypothetical protein